MLFLEMVLDLACSLEMLAGKGLCRYIKVLWKSLILLINLFILFNLSSFNLQNTFLDL